MHEIRPRLDQPEPQRIQCPGGIDLKAVETCLASLEANQCAQPGDAITRAARCPPSDLCMK